MAINPKPIVSIQSALNATLNNFNNITYSIIGQTEEIVGSQAYIYDGATGNQLCVYTINEAPAETQLGYLFPLHITSTSTNVEWTNGNSIATWANSHQYYIKIKVLSASGWSELSEGQLFWCLSTPSASFNDIPSTITKSSVTVSVAYSQNQTTVDNNVTSYTMVLINEYGDVVANSGALYGGGSNSFTYTFTGLEIGGTYKIIFTGTTEQGNQVITESNTFNVASDISLIGTLSAENVCDEGKITLSFTGSTTNNINIVAIERQKNGDTHWVRIMEKYVVDQTNIVFTYDDYFAQCGVQYSYRILPIYRQGDFDAVGSSSTTQPIVTSYFNQVYITDGTTTFKLISGVSNDSLTYNQRTSNIEPLGSTYPIIVKNAKTNYQSGSLSARIVPSDYAERRVIFDEQARYDMRVQNKEVMAFFTNGNPKVLKDWNGNIWIITFVDSPSINFDSNSNMSIGIVSGNWVEIGSIDDTSDLTSLGLANNGSYSSNSSIVEQSSVVVIGNSLIITNKPNITYKGNTLVIVQEIGFEDDALVFYPII